MAKPAGWVKPTPIDADDETTLPVRADHSLTRAAPADLSLPPHFIGTWIERACVIGRIMAQSGLFPDTKTEAQAVAKIVAGRSLGLDEMTSLTQIYMVNGRPSYSAQVIAGRLKQSSRYDYRLRELTPERCVLAFFEHGEERGESVFTMDDARVAGLLGKTVWKQYPRNMLFNRAITNGVRLYCPDLLLGCYTDEELGADPVDSDVIDGAATIQMLS